jgi:predicted Zn finger-like uncharacterized protein
MILTCPQCATRYQIADGKFPVAGRAVRCAKCRHTWFQAAPAAEIEAEPKTASTPESAPAMTASWQVSSKAGAAEPSNAPIIRPRGERTAILAAAAALTAIVALVIWAGVRYRDLIVDVWPQSGSLYSTLGLSVNARGLAFTDVNYRRETEAGQLVLTVRGNVVNVGRREVAVPKIEIVLSDKHHRQVDRWSVSSNADRLQPGQNATFTTSRANPPGEARHLEVIFAATKG